MSEHTFPITFTYDHALGVFYARLANGSSFPVSRSHIGGKLENALSLFARGVVAAESGRWRKPIEIKEGDLGLQYDESKVRRFTASGTEIRELSELDLDLEDLL